MCAINKDDTQTYGENSKTSSQTKVSKQIIKLISMMSVFPLEKEKVTKYTWNY